MSRKSCTGSKEEETALNQNFMCNSKETENVDFSLSVLLLFRNQWNDI